MSQVSIRSLILWCFEDEALHKVIDVDVDFADVRGKGTGGEGEDGSRVY